MGRCEVIAIRLVGTRTGAGLSSLSDYSAALPSASRRVETPESSGPALPRDAMDWPGAPLSVSRGSAGEGSVFSCGRAVGVPAPADLIAQISFDIWRLPIYDLGDAQTALLRFTVICYVIQFQQNRHSYLALGLVMGSELCSHRERC